MSWMDDETRRYLDEARPIIDAMHTIALDTDHMHRTADRIEAAKLYLQHVAMLQQYQRIEEQRRQFGNDFNQQYRLDPPSPNPADSTPDTDANTSFANPANWEAQS